jgi:hypothetical protein
VHFNLNASFTVLAVASSVFAHGVQTQITFNPTTGKIETRQVVATSTDVPADFPYGLTTAPQARVFVMPLLVSQLPLGDGYYTRPTDVRNPITSAPLHASGPGLTYLFDYQDPTSGWAHTGSSTLPNLAGTSFTYTFVDGLKSWSGAAWTDAGTEQAQMIRNGGTGTFTPSTVNAITSDVGPFASMPLTAISATAPGATSIPHSSLSFRLLGDGVSSTAASDDGIYLLSLRLSSTAVYGSSNTPVGDSDPFYLVMYKNTSLADAAAAANSFAMANGIPLAQVQLAVPEPATLGTIAGAAALLVRRSRK